MSIKYYKYEHRPRRIHGRLFLLTALSLVAFLAGCYSSVPVAENHRAYPQSKLEATDHWREIAADVADRVQKALHDRPDLLAKPIYIRPLTDQAFVLAYHDLLKTELVSRGLLVAIKQEPECVLLEYDVQTVRFGEERLSTPLSNTGVSISNIFSGNRYTDGSDNEVIINSWLSYGNRFVVHSSKLAYINDDDKKLYSSPANTSVTSSGSRTVRVVNKR